MGLYSDILEENRERSHDGYIDPCMIMSSSKCKYYKFEDYRCELNEYIEAKNDAVRRIRIRQEFIRRMSELENLKAGYLIAEKIVLEVINKENICSFYMKDMLDTLQFQFGNAYKAICQLESEIERNFDFGKTINFQSDEEERIRITVLTKLMNTTLHGMEEGRLGDASSFRKVVSDCAKVIRVLKNEEYHSSDKTVFSYYLTETMKIIPSHQKCQNCGKLLLSDLSYCLNCYERNM